MPTAEQSSTNAELTQRNPVAQPSSEGGRKAENGVSGAHEEPALGKMGKHDAEATEVLPGAGPHEWLSTDVSPLYCNMSLGASRALQDLSVM